MDSREKALEEIYSVPYWRQKIPIPTEDGIVATPGRSTKDKFESFGLEVTELNGKSVLDIGSWDGLHAFLAESMGASKVLATDVWEGGTDSDNPDWWADAHGNGDLAIRTAKKLRESSVDHQHLSVYDLSDADIGPFDYTLFPSVLYHLKHPFMALEEVAAVTEECAIIETKTAPLNVSGMKFYGGEGTPWWNPNREGLQDMVESAGFNRVEIVADNQFPYHRENVYLDEGAGLKRYQGGLVESGKKTQSKQRVMKLQDGDELGGSFSGHVYVEYFRNESPVQAWVEKQDILDQVSYLAQNPEELIRTLKWEIGQKWIKTGRLGGVAQYLAGIGPHVTVKAYK